MYVNTGVRTGARKVDVLGIGADHSLQLRAGGTSMNMAWSRLTLGEKRSLAQSVAREDNEADHCIVAFYAIAMGDDDGAREALSRCGVLAAMVEGFFTAAPGEANAD